MQVRYIEEKPLNPKLPRFSHQTSLLARLLLMIALFYARHKEEKKNPPKSDDSARRGPNSLAAMARGVCLKGAWTGKRMQACKAPLDAGTGKAIIPVLLGS